MDRDIYKEFPITFITREDVLRYLPEAYSLTDEQMRRIADKMEDLHLEWSFWEDLKIACEEMEWEKNYTK